MAGASMKDIKLRIRSVESTKQITSAMQLVAGSKLRRARQRMEDTRPYMTAAREVIAETEAAFAETFGRQYTGLTESYLTDDADYIIVTLGSIAGLCRETAGKLRKNGVKAGVVRIRYMRPFPNEEIADILRNAKAYAVLEKDVSFGNEGTVFTNVNSALKKAGVEVRGSNYIGGLGGRNISAADIEKIYTDIANGAHGVEFIGIGGGDNG